MAENYSSGTIPLRTNPIRVIEVKILNALNGGSGGLAGGSQGSGAPSTPPSNTGVTSFYVDTNTGVLYYWNTTTQAWT